MASLSRRAFVTAVTVVVSAFRRTFVVTAQSTSFDDFIARSRRLTGQSTLDEKLGRVYFEALQSASDADVTEAWYTGAYKAGNDTRVATVSGALMWKAIGIAAPASCALPFGSWSRPPRAN